MKNKITGLHVQYAINKLPKLYIKCAILIPMSFNHNTECKFSPLLSCVIG